MLSVAARVERIVMDSQFLVEGLRRNLINLSELARQLQPQLETDLWKPVGQAAVVMALRRVTKRLPAVDRPAAATGQKTGELTTRTDLSEYTYRQSDTLAAGHRQLLERMAVMDSAFVMVTRGVNELMVICNRSAQPVVEEVFAGQCLRARQDGLTALTLHFHGGQRSGPGIYQSILSQLAWEQIQLVNLICTYTELTLLMEPGQTAAAYKLLAQTQA